MKFKRGFTLVELIVIIAILGILTAMFIPACIGGPSYFKKEQVNNVCVTDKEVKRSGGEKDKYLIFTNKGTFEITDSLIHMRFNSSDLYGMISKDRCYNFIVTRFRSGFLSEYRNILEVEETNNVNWGNE